jgi:hypothetical protein
MPLEFCAGFSTFSFQVLLLSARAPAPLRIPAVSAQRGYIEQKSEYNDELGLSNGEGNVHLPDSFHARARGMSWHRRRRHGGCDVTTNRQIEINQEAGS